MSPDFDPFMTDPLNTSVFPALRDTLGNEYPLSSPPSGFDPGALGENQRVLFFAPAAPGDSRYHLSLPAVYMRVPAPQSFEVDLGASPQPGASWDVDLPVEVANQTVRFTRAELIGDGTASLTLKLTTDPCRRWMARWSPPWSWASRRASRAVSATATMAPAWKPPSS